MLPHQDRRYGGGRIMAKSQKSMRRPGGAPRIWVGMAKAEMISLGFKASDLKRVDRISVPA